MSPGWGIDYTARETTGSALTGLQEEASCIREEEGDGLNGNTCPCFCCIFPFLLSPCIWWKVGGCHLKHPVVERWPSKKSSRSARETTGCFLACMQELGEAGSRTRHPVHTQGQAVTPRLGNRGIRGGKRGRGQHSLQQQQPGGRESCSVFDKE